MSTGISASTVSGPRSAVTRLICAYIVQLLNLPASLLGRLPLTRTHITGHQLDTTLPPLFRMSDVSKEARTGLSSGRLSFIQWKLRSSMAEALRSFYSSIPIDIWNEVIDWASMNREQVGPFPACYATLRSCALVCRSWRHRSQYNLFCRAQFFLSPTIPSPLCSLLQTASQNGFLGSAVADLIVDSIRADRYIPIGIITGPGMRSPPLTRLQTVTLTRVDWRSPRLRNLSMAVSLPEHLSSLDLYDNMFNTAFDLLSLVWSVPLLSRLTMQNVTIERRVSERELARLSSALPSKPCSQLRSLRIKVRIRFLCCASLSAC